MSHVKAIGWGMAGAALFLFLATKVVPSVGRIFIASAPAPATGKTVVTI